MILSIDCGTQSLKAILYSYDGEVIDKEQYFYKAYDSPNPGWAEQDPMVYWEGLCQASLKLKQRNPRSYNKIDGIGITSLRDTMVSLDKDGKILRPTIVWLDQRIAKNTYKPKFTKKIALKITGMGITIRKLERKGSSNWLKQNQPEIWAKTNKYIVVSAFLNHKLSGTFNDSIASQIGLIPFNFKKQRWAKKIDIAEMSKEIFPIERDKLPDLVPAGGLIGNITEEASRLTGINKGTKIIACGSDKGCETIGMGVTDTKIASLSFGTQATIQTTTNKYFEPVPFLPSYPAVIPNSWNPEIEIYRGFWMINWFKNEFALKEVMEAEEQNVRTEEVMDRLLHKSPPGAQGLIVHPYWTPSLSEKNAKGAIIGFGDVHKKEHIYRAVIEGLCYGLRNGKERLEKRGKIKFEKIAVSGGASQSDEICQIAADIFNLEILRGKTHETSTLGAAIVTSFGVGKYKSVAEAAKSMVHYSESFTPNPDNIKLYNDLFSEVYLKIYDKLEPLYQKIQDITGYPE